MGFNTGSYNSTQYNTDSETITLVQGDVAAQTSFTGSILSSKILTSTISGETNTSASLTTFDKRTLSASVQTQTSLTGALTTFDQRALSGTITGETGFFGDVTDFDKRRLSASVQTQTLLTADLAAIQPLSGAINAQTSLTGALTTFDQRTLSGTITGTTTNSGKLSTAQLITGTIETDTGLPGDLTAFDQRILKATAETATNITGDLTTKDFRTLTGAIETGSELTAQIRMTQLVSGSTNTETSFKGLLRAEEVQPVYQRFTPQKMYSISRENAENLAGQIDDPANRPEGQLVYKSKPRVKSQSFNGYPFIVVEQFQLNDFQDTVNNLNTEWDFDVELHVFGRENNETQLNQFENILNQLTALTQTDIKHELNKNAGISRLQVIRQNRLTGINEKDQPIIRYEYVIRGKLHVGMDVFEDRT